MLFDVYTANFNPKNTQILPVYTLLAFEIALTYKLVSHILGTSRILIEFLEFLKNSKKLVEVSPQLLDEQDGF